MKCFFNTTLSAPITTHTFKMSLNNNSKQGFSMVVEKPQNGKTGICIDFIMKSIAEDKRTISIVLTMNKLTASSQFIGRIIENEIPPEQIGRIIEKKKIPPDQVVVFNSKKLTGEKYHHAKTYADLWHFITSKKYKIKVIVCLGNSTRITDSLPALFTDIEELANNNINFVIHIDEAHACIPTKKNIPFIRKFGASPVVSQIIGYSATPHNIWKPDKDDSMFYKILIRNVESELAVTRSDYYFGVKDCNMHVLSEDVTHDELVSLTPIRIPDHIISQAHKNDPKHNGDKQPRDEWYGEDFPLSLGNEMLMLGYLTHILPTLPIDPNCFSYHFAPAFTRKVTHYQCMELILDCWPTANAIVHNGNGFELFRKNDSSGKIELVITSHTIRQRAEELENEDKLHDLCEPAYMVQELIQEKNPNRPTFITGFMCVQMSVTLINPAIGNFHSVIMSHQHLNSEILYQLCRFLFNYERWTPEQRATTKRITNFYSLTQSVIDQCLEYEEHDERITTEFAGRTCSLREIQGLEPEEPTAKEIEEQEKDEAFRAIELRTDKEGGKLCKKFKAYDGNCDEVWEKAQAFYKSIRGKRISGKSMPTKVDGFYHCSGSGEPGVQTVTTFNALSNEKWSGRFQLKQNQLSYARVFVGYDNLEDPTEYSIFIKFVELVDTPSTREYLAKYHPKKAKTSTASSVSVATAQSQEEEGAGGGGPSTHK